MTSRELVYATLEFRNETGQVPRQMWTLPWAEKHHGEALGRIREQYPDDIVGAPVILAAPAHTAGDPYAAGEYVDEWGCRFSNIHEGVIGEAKEPVITGEEWENIGARIPEELLTFDRDAVNAFCRRTDKFVTSGCCPRPFEQLQFLRSTEEFYMDLMDPPERMLSFMKEMHLFYCELLEAWAQTDVDALTFMDDWGSQKSLLIHPDMWQKYFRPMYRDYINIAKKYGKKTFMHSDGYIMDIYPHLVELGLDAVNSQLFCMGLDQVKQYKGKITFWGEIDRQHILPEGTPKEVEEAVAGVREALWDNGGCIAQCEFGPGAKPENVEAVFRAWNRIEKLEE